MNPEMDPILRQVENIYTTVEGIEAGAIQDAQQFHALHGGRYLLGEVLEASLKVPINRQESERACHLAPPTSSPVPTLSSG